MDCEEDCTDNARESEVDTRRVSSTGFCSLGGQIARAKDALSGIPVLSRVVDAPT